MCLDERGGGEIEVLKSRIFAIPYLMNFKIINMEQNELEILDLIDVINSETEKCCSEILQLTEVFARKYRKLLPQMPYNINVIDELHINENGHSRILKKLLQYKNEDGKYEILESLLQYIANDMRCEKFYQIKVSRPKITQEKCRIDLWVRDSSYALIFENKVYDATDQEAQIHRYIERTIEENYKKEQIYVIYLPSYDKEPETQSWGDYKSDFKDRYANVSFRNGILPWLKKYVLPNVRTKDKLLLSAVTQYIDYLEGLFSLRTINNKINMELQEFISGKIFNGKESTTQKIKIVKSRIADIDNLQKQLSTMKDKYEREWLKEILKNNQPAERIDDKKIEKKVGNWTIALALGEQQPWWGVNGKSKNINALIKDIKEKMNKDETSLRIKDEGYLVWCYTSIENGESRLKKLIEILSEY